MSAATILTLANGRGIDLLDPLSSDIDFESIAEHLAKEKRYNGATPGIEYSVAEHCCRGADAILAEGGYASESVAAFFLLHDAHEAFIKDLTTPLKVAVAQIASTYYKTVPAEVIDSFDILERRIDAAIYKAAGFRWPLLPQFKSEVKRFDLIMFVTEWRDLMGDIEHPNWAPYERIQPLVEKIVLPWPWEVARRQYLARCMKLLPVFKEKLALAPIERRATA